MGKINKNTVTSFVYSREKKQLKSTRVLYYSKDRLINYDLSSELIIQRIISPVSVAICPTSFCDRACSFCSNKQRNLHNRKNNIKLSEKVFLEITEDLKKLDVKGISFAGGGEPLSYDDNLLTSFFCQKEINYKIGIHTNGINLNKFLSKEIIESNNIAYINVSCSAHNENLYKTITGKSFNQFRTIEHNIRNIQALRKNMKNFPTFGIKILICRENYKFIYEIYQYFLSLGVENILLRCVGNFELNQDVQLNPFQLIELNKLLTDNFRLDTEQINTILGTPDIYYPKATRCWIVSLQYTAGIDPDGEVYLCSPWSRKEFSIGNVNKNRLVEIWGGKKHKEIAQKLNNNLQSNLCNQLTCRHFSSNLSIDLFLKGTIEESGKNTLEDNYGRFI